MRYNSSFPFSVVPPDRLTISIAAMSRAAIDHESVAAKIHAAVLSSLPNSIVGVAQEFDVVVRFDFRPYLTAPIIGRLRIGMFVAPDVADNLDSVVANETDRAIRDYRLTRVIGDAQLLQAAIYTLLHWGGGSTIVVEKALRDIEILAVTYGADPADVLAYPSVADHAGRPVPEPGAGSEDDAVAVMRAA